MRIEQFTIIVDDYDKAIGFFTGALGFDLVEDSPSLTGDGRPKRRRAGPPARAAADARGRPARTGAGHRRAHPGRPGRRRYRRRAAYLTACGPGPSQGDSRSIAMRTPPSGITRRAVRVPLR